MTSRREVIGIVASAGIASLAGCANLITGDGPIKAEADQLIVEQATVEETDYELAQAKSPPFEKTVSIAGNERQIVLTNEVVGYENAVGAARKLGGVFTLLSTPAIDIANKSVNPLMQLSNKELAKQVASQRSGDGGSIENIEVESEYEATVDGNTTTVTKFSATTTVEGKDVPLYMHLTKTPVGDNYAVVGAVYPQRIDELEHDTVKVLIEGIEEATERVTAEN